MPKSTDVNRPKRPLSAYNLFYRFKRQQLIEAGQNASGGLSKEDVHRLVSTPAGLEFSRPTFVPANCIVQTQRYNIRQVLNHAKLHSNSQAKRSHRKSQYAFKTTFVEMNEMMLKSWTAVDKDTKAVFAELHDEARKAYAIEMSEYFEERKREKLKRCADEKLGGEGRKQEKEEEAEEFRYYCKYQLPKLKSVADSSTKESGMSTGAKTKFEKLAEAKRYCTQMEHLLAMHQIGIGEWGGAGGVVMMKPPAANATAPAPAIAAAAVPANQETPAAEAASNEALLAELAKRNLQPPPPQELPTTAALSNEELEGRFGTTVGGSGAVGGGSACTSNLISPDNCKFAASMGQGSTFGSSPGGSSSGGSSPPQRRQVVAVAATRGGGHMMDGSRSQLEEQQFDIELKRFLSHLGGQMMEQLLAGGAAVGMSGSSALSDEKFEEVERFLCLLGREIKENEAARKNLQN